MFPVAGPSLLGRAIIFWIGGPTSSLIGTLPVGGSNVLNPFVCGILYRKLSASSGTQLSRTASTNLPDGGGRQEFYPAHAGLAAVLAGYWPRKVARALLAAVSACCFPVKVDRVSLVGIWDCYQRSEVDKAQLAAVLECCKPLKVNRLSLAVVRDRYTPEDVDMIRPAVISDRY